MLIPLQLLIDKGLILMAANADLKIADSSAQGHPAPALSILAMLVAAIFTIIVIVASFILVGVRYAILSDRYKLEKSDIRNHEPM